MIFLIRSTFIGMYLNCTRPIVKARFSFSMPATAPVCSDQSRDCQGAVADSAAQSDQHLGLIQIQSDGGLDGGTAALEIQGFLRIGGPFVSASEVAARIQIAQD